MQRVLSTDLWKAVKAKAGKARRRKAAIAYVTRDLIGLVRDDVLIVNASKYAVTNGETNAELLRGLYREGVRLYHCDNLHAKTVLLDTTALIGSSNMSRSSEQDLVEAGLLTDHPSTVSGVASLIEQLIQQSIRLDNDKIEELCRIKVVRRGGGRRGGKRAKVSHLGNRTWLAGVRPLVREETQDEQNLIARATKILRSRTGDADLEPNCIKFGRRSRLGVQCREGDSVIEIWRASYGAKRPSKVLYAAPVLLKQRTDAWTRVYLGDVSATKPELSWGQFQRLLKQLGYDRPVGISPERVLDDDLADAISRRWRTASKQK